MTLRLRKWYILMFCFLPMLIHGQGSLSVGYGASIYKGDLSLNGFFEDFKNTGTAFNVNVKVPVFNNFRVRLGYFNGHLQADDALSTDRAINIRNLNFFSTIHEFSLGADYVFSNTFLPNSPVELYAIGGAAYFNNKAKTYYNGLLVDLSELGTEGQVNPYKTADFAIQMGGGVNLHLNEAMSISFELIGRITQYDYLDDVSGTYPDYETVLSQNGILAASLSDRRDEFFNEAEGTTDLPGVGENGTRGNPSSNDYYASFIVSFVVRFGQSGNSPNKGILCPTL